MFWTENDALGRTVQLPLPPQRILSLVPSQTELLVDLGVKERLIGRTRYCIHPKGRVENLPTVGGTKRVDEALIEALRPDLILAEKEENPKEMVESLARIAPVYVTDVVSLPSAIAMIETVGRLVDCAHEGARLCERIRTEMDSVRAIAPRSERILYLIWKKPWMAVAQGTFIDACLTHLGFRNALSPGAFEARYPELSDAQITELKPDRIFLSSEPYPFQEKHIDELQRLAPAAHVSLVDGEMFSWYGSRMLEMAKYWRGIGNPAL